MTEREAAEKAAHDVASALGVSIPTPMLGAAADLILGAVAAVTGVSLKRAERARDAAVAAIATDTDAAKELSR